MALATSASLLAGCGGATTKDSGPSRAASPSRTASAAATSGAGSSADPSASASPRPAGPAGDLLGADQLPAFGAVSTWTIGSTAPAGPAPFGACQEYDFATIGATSALVRSYTAVDGPDATAAAERVVSFPDATNAARAAKVLESFRATCAKRLRGQLPHLAVSTARAVPVPSGTASSYTVSWSPADGSSAHHTEEIGTVVLGSTIAVITLESDTAPAGGGSDPMRHTLAAAAQLLG